MEAAVKILKESIERIKKTMDFGDRFQKGVIAGLGEAVLILKKENANSGQPLLVDGCVAMDERRYLSMISDMSQYWSAENPNEQLAMKWMAIKIFNKFIVTEKKATVS